MPRNTFDNAAVGNRKFRWAGDPALVVRAECTTCDDAMHVDVPAEVLPPGTQHYGDAEFATEPSGIAAEFE